MTSIPFSFPTFPAWFRSPPSIAELSPRAIDWVSKCWSSSEIYCCYKVEESENVRHHAIRNLWSLCFGNMVVFCFSRCPAKGHPAHIRGVYINFSSLWFFPLSILNEFKTWGCFWVNTRKSQICHSAFLCNVMMKRIIFQRDDSFICQPCL